MKTWKNERKKLNHKTYTYIYQLVSYYLLIWLHYHQPTTKPNSVIHYSSLSFLIHDTMYFVSLFSVSLTMINKWIHSEKKFCISWYLFLTSKSCIFTAGLVSEFGMRNLAKEIEIFKIASCINSYPRFFWYLQLNNKQNEMK